MKNVYLDYCATTPVDDEVLNYYVSIIKRYIGNPNSIHFLGSFSKKFYSNCKKNIANKLGCNEENIIFTSCASESNSTVFRNLIYSYPHKKHIIVSYLDHKSVLDEARRLSNIGYRVSYVKIQSNGLVDLDDLKSLICDETILVSICGVNSETGYIQDLNAIRSVIDSVNPNILLHSDLTQALGKIKIDLSCLDFASFSSYKIYAPSGIGVLYKSSRVKLDNLIGGTTSNSKYRGGTPLIHLIGAFDYALNKIYNNLEENYQYVKKLNEKLVNGLKELNVKINSNENSIPHIVNISLLNMDSNKFINEMSLCGISVSSKSACSIANESEILMEITNNDKIISSTSIRISLSHLTSMDDIDYFLLMFKKIYSK